MTKIAIISHTEHYLNDKGKVVGWEPTIREINHFPEKFNIIYHLAPLHSGSPHRANIAYNSDKIIFQPLIPSGGKSIFKKIGIILFMPINLIRIIKVINKVDWIHFRSPTSLGLFVLPLVYLFSKKNKWIKYAGNWQQNFIPFSYKFQRWWLKKNLNNSFVIINGVWKNQASHLLSFHNPCLTERELSDANTIGFKKDFSGLLNICFVGRAGNNKGAAVLLEALSSFKKINIFNEVNFIGLEEKDIAINSFSLGSARIKCNGWISRSQLDKIYAKSHLIILPTKSEGFPKVIAEASAFGCIPIVTNIEPINQIVINRKNGILLDAPKVENIKKLFLNLEKKDYDLKVISNEAISMSKLFTYNRYLDRIKSEIIDANIK